MESSSDSRGFQAVRWMVAVLAAFVFITITAYATFEQTVKPAELLESADLVIDVEFIEEAKEELEEEEPELPVESEPLEETLPEPTVEPEPVPEIETIPQEEPAKQPEPVVEKKIEPKPVLEPKPKQKPKLKPKPKAKPKKKEKAKPAKKKTKPKKKTVAKKITKNLSVGAKPIRRTSPSYPKSALRRKIEGAVKVSMQINAKGRVVSASVVKSSGNRDLDKAAVKTVKRWRFSPAKNRGGVSIPSQKMQTIIFKLPG